MVKKLEKQVNDESDLATVNNSLSGLCDSLNSQTLFSGGAYGQGAQVSQTDTLYINNRWYLLSNYRQLLSQLYVEHGIVQTLVDQPVDDGFRAGFEVKTNQLDADDIEKLLIYVERHQVVASIMQASKWARLFGGGAVLIITDQNPATPLEINKINEKSKIEFRAVDMWELYNTIQNVEGDLTIDGALGMGDAEFYDYYGHKVHHTRVFRIMGKAPPSFVRPRLRGWGMSELERLVRSINQYMKNQDVVFDLLDEAKVDVYKIKGFTASLLNSVGTAQVSKRIQAANFIKDYNNALVMDKEDEYEQKQITFAGLADVLTQIRQGVAADLKMPVTKLFGISAAGFNSGEDDIENYNSMIEGEIRAKVKFIVVDVLQIVCQKLFGFMPDDLMIEFKPLRILNAKEEEEVKTHQFNRLMSVWQAGGIPIEEFKAALNKDSLLPIEVDETIDALPPIGGDFLSPAGEKVEGEK